MHRQHQSPHRSRPTALQPLAAQTRQLRLTSALRLLPAQDGWLAVTEGRVWLTVSGQPDDHVLLAGERLWLARSAQVVVEPWCVGEHAGLHWSLAMPAVAAPARPVPSATWGVRLGRALSVVRAFKGWWPLLTRVMTGPSR